MRAMPLTTLLGLQAVFAVSSVAYLLFSMTREATTGEPLSAVPIGPSLALFGLYMACLLLPRFRQIGMYRIAMVAAIVIFGGGGVIGNVVLYLQTGLENYASFGAWTLAVAINAYGTLLNTIAAFGWFEHSYGKPRDSDIR